jgi:hypothetical protein
MGSIIKERITEIKQEIQRLEAEVNLKKNVLKELELVSSRKGQRASKCKSKPPRKGSLAEYLVKVLNGSLIPMPVAEIVEALKAQGYQSDATVGLNNLVPSALTRRPDLFFKVKHGVYGLIGKHKQEEG